MLTRRELLTAFLGAPLAAAACARHRRPALPPGEIVGTSNVVGHRIRDGWRPHPSPGAPQPVRVVIVGAGIAGLAAAWWLRRAGVDDFVILELEAKAGGTAQSGESLISRFPWGAHYVPAPLPENRTFVTLLEEMRLIASGTSEVDDGVLVRDPQERLFYRGTWYEGLYLHAGASGDDLRQLDRFRAIVDGWVAWRDRRGRRAFAIPVALSSDDPEPMALDRLSMAAFLDHHALTSPRLRWMIDYACRDDYGCHLSDASAWAGLFYFASRVASPKAESQPLMTWPEGNGHFVDHFLDRIGDRVRTSTAVTEIVPTAVGLEVIAVQGHHVGSYLAQHVILAVPQFIASRLIGVPERSRAFTYGAWMVANIALRDRPSERTFPLAWDNVLYDSPSLGYVVSTHQLDRDRGPTVFTYYYAMADSDPSHARRRLLAAGRDDWAEIALADLSIPHPEIRELATRVDIMRWGHAMIRPYPGFLSSPARLEAAKPVDRIHFANTDLSGVALFEEALFHGVRAAEEVMIT
jgi:phytoene dehydrogenase-like protein